ncbi:HAD family hydrolase [Brytella acorum]|uniref:HAD family hydrolase n=1 Tax=Brytella acorum TaxID=2959299 RepID=A0AA35UYW1_9PROT|nr:HAD family hydrolase [Brytella acorum]MDF3626043.1 HAD family hydrolase [Brytella acorum]CAI9122144.1 HAD family hydrolase [Brytella acorum]
MSSSSLFPGREFDAFLFDMDGTILTSVLAAERVWSRWAERHGLDPEPLLANLHGVRMVDTIARQNLPNVDIQAEARWITDRELEDIHGVVPVPGAEQFLASLPPDRWAIVTSAPHELALRRLSVTGLPMPRVLVTAESIKHGKPQPDCFLLGAEKLGFEARNCVVFEDAPAGIKAGEAASAAVVVITHTHSQPRELGHPAIADYTDVSARTTADGRLEIISVA